jgi:hypothetical protein
VPPEEAPTAEDPLVAESRLIARAIDALRRVRDPAAALAVLDQHQKQFPNGALRDEARFARIESLVASGDSSAALQLLGELRLDGHPRELELRLLEAELRAERGECETALATFDRILTNTEPGPNQRRALQGRAACLDQLKLR